MRLAQPPRQQWRAGGLESAFTLIELLVVIAIMVVLMTLLTPAFTSIKGAGDATKAAYDVEGVLENARSYATANNTYVWVGFFEENESLLTSGSAGIGRIVMSTVASKDGTMIYNPNQIAAISGTSLNQINKLVKIDNMHLKTAAAGDASFPIGDGTGDPAKSPFVTRPAGSDTSPWQIGDTTPNNSQTPFNYPTTGTTYTFYKAIQFSPRGEARVDNVSYPLQPVIEIGLQPTHGTVVDTNNKNVAAVQITGIAGNVKIYRR